MDMHAQDFLKKMIEEANQNQTKELQDIINDIKTEINEFRNTISRNTEGERN